MTSWSFLTNHGKALLCVAHQPDIRLRDIGAQLNITEKCACNIVNDLVEADFLIKVKVGRRNHYLIQEHRPFPGTIEREPDIGAVLDLFTGREGPVEATASSASSVPA